MPAKNDWLTLPSREDVSVNFTKAASDGGYLEARYVRRAEDYFVCYLSSHTGCLKACRMCHLTATGQTMFAPVSIDDYFKQARIVLAHYAEAHQAERPASIVNFNWMARGEPLSNPYMSKRAADILAGLSQIAAEYDLAPRFNLSTILPDDAPDLVESFGELDVTFYYSLYSLDPSFRRRWLPRAMAGEAGLERLAEWQRASGREIVLHWAFIEGQNDSEKTIDDILERVQRLGLKTRFNLVRYNAPTGKSRESKEAVLDARLRQIAAVMPARMIQRVGFDVNASCGMFVGGEAEPS